MSLSIHCPILSITPGQLEESYEAKKRKKEQYPTHIEYVLYDSHYYQYFTHVNPFNPFSTTSEVGAITPPVMVQGAQRGSTTCPRSHSW